MQWTVVLLGDVEDWFLTLVRTDPESAKLVEAAIDLLEQRGPSLGRPLVDRIKGSRHHHLKELRPGSAGASEVRVLFAFDPARQAVLLVAGDKAGDWRGWYRTNVPVAEARYDQWLETMKEDDDAGS